MYFTKADTEKILDRSEGKLIEIIGQFVSLRQAGASWVGKCPKCGSERGLTVTPGKNIFTCFKCKEVKGTRPVDYLLTGEDKTFPEALKYLADHYSIIPEADLRPAPVAKSVKTAPKKKGKDSDSFCAKMLSDSGLTFEDVTASVYKSNDISSIFKERTFAKGTLSETGDIDSSGNDVIIKYYDLDGFPVTYTQKDSKKRDAGRTREYFRVRWQYPEEHKDKSGKPAKYRSPYGAGSFVYIPEKIRAAYKNKQIIDRLFIQEGEKKAEKASKHGIMSLGIAGIQNLGHEGKLPEEVAKIIQVCQVREVVFLMDSDCFDLTTHLKINEPVERRPKNFFYAVKNYKEYFNVLKNRGLYVEVYFGYVLKNENGDKGVDDLLTNQLAKKEDELSEDINQAINLKDMKGRYIQLHKITTMTDSRILEIWSLQSPKSFCEKYYSELKSLPEFMFGQHKWRFNEEGELETAQPLEADEQFWQEKKKEGRDGSFSVNYEFKYTRCFRFLAGRGFGRYRKQDGTYEFVHFQKPFIKTISHIDARDYLVDFTKTYANEEVLEMLYRGGPQYLGPDKLSHLDYINPVFEVPVRERQFLYFNSCFWDITPGKIEQKQYDQISHHIWADSKKEFDATILPDLIQVKKDSEGKFSFKITDLGKKCQFLKFLENTSNFTWRKEKMLREGTENVSISPEELYENVQHIVAKLCSIGFLITSVKDRSIAKAVVAVDGKQSEVGISNGRSGKSLIGELLKRCAITQYINGKTVDLLRDTFIWDELSEKTKLVFIDDVKRDFPFELMFANITGDWAVNVKGDRRFTLEFKNSPKIYITTNHMLSGEGSSFLDRQWNIAFSDYYNEDHKPADDFGCMFFDEWDFEQWNLTWNLVAQCVKLYFQFGCVESPGERIEMRKLRQNMTEEFILWADEYFSNDAHRNVKIARRTIYENLIETVGVKRSQYYTPHGFKKKIKDFCRWKGYRFNPHKYDPVTGEAKYFDKDGNPDDDDKSGGVEYFTIADVDHEYISEGAKPGGYDPDIFNTPLED